MTTDSAIRSLIAALRTPPAIKERPDASVYVPPGFLLLKDAIDEAGKNLFPKDHPSGEWNGRELLARAQAVIGEKPAGPILIPGRTIPAVPTSLTARTRGSDEVVLKGKYLVHTTTGPKSFTSKEDAEAFWESSKAAVWTEHDAELAALKRFNSAVLDLRNKLADSSIGALIFAPDSGNRFPIVSEGWAATGAADVFHLGDQIARWRRPNYATMLCRTAGGAAKVSGHVVIPSVSINAAYPAPTPTADDIAAEVTAQLDAAGESESLKTVATKLVGDCNSLIARGDEAPTRPVSVEGWPAPQGEPKRIRGYGRADAALLDEMQKTIDEEQISVWAAAGRVESRALGSKEPGARQKRLVERYYTERAPHLRNSDES